MKTLGKLLERNSRLHGKEKALVYNDQRLTYSELRRRGGGWPQHSIDWERDGRTG